MSEILVLQHAEAETLGSIAGALTARGHRFRYVRGFAGEPVPERLEADGLVVLGGPMSAYEGARWPFLAGEVRLVQSALELEKPVLGVCLGSQILASALGARVYPSGGKEIGWHPVQLDLEFQRDRLFASAGQVFTAFHWHGDVFDLPKGAVSLGHSARTFHQGFRHGGKAYGLLFHIEVTAELVDGMVRAFPDEMREAGVEASTLLDGNAQHLERVQKLAADVFGGWAALVG